MRNIFEGIDGAKGNYKDGNVIDNWEITLTATVKEMTAKKLSPLINMKKESILKLLNMDALCLWIVLAWKRFAEHAKTVLINEVVEFTGNYIIHRINKC